MVPGINFRKGKRCLFLFLFIFVNYARIVVTESGVLNLDRKFRKNIKVVCTDMWQAYLHVLNEKVPNAINVLDKFHIMQKNGKSPGFY